MKSSSFTSFHGGKGCKLYICRTILSNMKLFSFFFLSFFFSFPIFSQIKFDSTAIRILLSDTLPYHRTYCRQPIAWDDFAHNPGNAIKVDNIIYFIPDQYGAVFEIQENADSIQVNRIDHTKYSGLTAGQYIFYDKHLYSFGGYGFWHTNGQLRIYLDDKKEWDIVKLNEVVPSTNFFTWYDPKEKMLWCGRQDHVNEVLDAKTFKTGFDAYRLNLKKQTWENLGSINFKPTNSNVYEAIYIETPYGVMVNSGGPKFEVWNFRENSKYDIGSISDSLRMLFIGTMLIGEHSLFLINERIIIYDHTGKQVVKSFSFGKTNLVLQKGALYEVHNGGISNYWVYLFLLLPLALLIYYYKYVQKLLQHLPFRKAVNKNGQTRSALVSPTVLQLNGKTDALTREQVLLNQLTNLELALVRQLSKDTKSGFRTQTEMIDHILGTEKKTDAVQKKQRSEVLGSINKKYGKVYNTPQLLIDKDRSESDGRLYEYFLNQDIDLS